jgi:hypothetical protein
MPLNPGHTRAIAKREELRLERANAGPEPRPTVSDEDDVIARAERRRKEREAARTAGERPAPQDEGR